MATKLTLKNAVNEYFDFAKAHECDLAIAYAKIAYEIKTGSRDFMTMDDLDRAKAFTDKHYNVVVEARQTGDETKYNEALAEWEDEN